MSDASGAYKRVRPLTPRTDFFRYRPPVFRARAAIRRILLIRPSALGDVCRSVHVVAALRRAFPDAAVDWLVQREFADAVSAHPGVSRVVPFDRRGVGGALARGRVLPLMELRATLRGARYDLVVDAQGLARSAWLGWLTGCPFRVGYANAAEGASLLYTAKVPVERGLHTVDRMRVLAMAAIRAGGGRPADPGSGDDDLRLFAPAADLAAVDARIGAGPRPVVVAPTSRWAGKAWPMERFSDLIARLLAAGVPRVAVVGAGREREACASLLTRFEGDPRVLDLVGGTSVGGLMAWVGRSRLVVANDSAALHMAVGFGRPLVALFGPTETGRVGPYGRESDVLQDLGGVRLRPGDHKREAFGVGLMRRLSTERVLEACVARLGWAGPAS